MDDVIIQFDDVISISFIVVIVVIFRQCSMGAIVRRARSALFVIAAAAAATFRPAVFRARSSQPVEMQ
jgi:hypothetical protein